MWRIKEEINMQINQEDHFLTVVLVSTVKKVKHSSGMKNDFGERQRLYTRVGGQERPPCTCAM